ncbi:hypothetical protein Pelo_15793 [Pelomyxa schiedti]|nr:hypothetical protein Pelo_15793 [Pelomyxa schiedti]
MSAANKALVAPSEGVGGGGDVVCGVCMDMYRDPVTLECGHTICRSCVVATLVPIARLTHLPAMVTTITATTTTTPTTTTTVTTKPNARGGGGAAVCGTMPGQTNAPQYGAAAASTSPCGTSFSPCRWGCCSPDTPVLSQELNAISQKEVEAIAKVNTETFVVPKVITDGCMSILADLQLIQSAVETRCKEITEMSQLLSDAMTHNLGIQCTSLEAIVKNHQTLVSKVNQVAQQHQPDQQQQPLACVILMLHHFCAHTFVGLLSPITQDTQRLEPCEQAKGVTWKSGPRDEVIGMIRGFGTVTKGRVPNTPSGGRAPTCTRSSSSSPQSQQATDATPSTITVQWDKPSPLSNETTPEQVVGYNVIVSHSSSASSSSPAAETGASVMVPPVVIEVKGRETTKCDVTVDSKSEVSVAVCAVSLVGSSEPTQRATVPPLPPGPREVEVFAWGAAGGADNAHNMAGGPGGFSTARMLIKTGTQLTIVVGQGGAGVVFNRAGVAPATRRSFGGGGSGGGGHYPGHGYSGGGGGGYSAVMVGGVSLVVAGGGGGSAVNHCTHGYGGGGGGETGSADGDHRKRATQQAPGGWGDNSPQCGGICVGGDGANAGNSDCGGGGGGGGLYGGAGGHTYSQGTGDTGGGGGSGYAVAPTTGGAVGDGGCVVGVISSRTVCGQRATSPKQATTPPETNNEHYRDGAGGCVAPTTHDHPFDGNNGLVVVVVKGGSGPSTNTNNTSTHVFHYTGQNQSLTIE